MKNLNVMNFEIFCENMPPHAGADFRGGAVDWTPFLRDSTPCRPKGSPLWYFLRNPFWPTYPKISLKRLWRQYFLFLSGKRAPKKHIFLVKIFQKRPKNAFLDCFFFQFFACGAEHFAKKGTKPCLGRAQNSIIQST